MKSDLDHEFSPNSPPTELGAQGRQKGAQGCQKAAKRHQKKSKELIYYITYYINI